MSPYAERIKPMVLTVLGDDLRTVGDIERTTGWRRHDLHDAVYELVREGRIEILPDSRLRRVP